MTYEVWISLPDGSSRLDLVPRGDDADAAADLVGALVRVVSGPLAIGVTIGQGAEGGAAAGGAAAAAKPGEARPATHRAR